MINLLPVAEKRQISAGRVNVILRRYCIVSLMLTGLLVIVIVGLYIIMFNNKSDAQRLVDDGNRRLAAEQSTQREIDTFRNNLLTAKTILSNEIHYSQVITKIAGTMPPGTVLQSLTLSADSFGKPMTLSAQGRSNADAITLKTSLEKSDIFQNVHLESVTAAASSDGKSKYPVSISVNVTLKPEVAKQ